MNVLTFTGNLGNDCRKGNAGGSAVVNFSVAMKSGYGDKAQTVWVDCALWGKQAESRLPEYLVKGAQVAVSGEMGTREHEGKTYVTCRVSSISLIGGRSESAPAQKPQPAQQGYAPPAAGFDEDVPF
jgi:single-strand DNA-binding protein